MTTASDAPAPETGARRTLELDGELVRIERPTGRKAQAALALLRALSRAMPELQRELARFRRDYEADNVLELDRVQARLRFPPQPLRDAAGEPVLGADGEPLLLPSPVDRLTAEDWQSAGDRYRVPASPSFEETMLALFDRALEAGEDNVYRLLALFTMSNADVKRARRDGSLADVLQERADELLDDALAEELLELAVVVLEVLSSDFAAKLDELGGRVGNLRRRLGMAPAPATTTPDPATSSSPSPADGATSSSATSPEERPSSSSPSAEPSPDGDPTTSSSSRTTSSSSSPASSSSRSAGEPNGNGSSGSSAGSPTATAEAPAAA